MEEEARFFNHPQLGNLVPKLSEGINQFLGLKYATLRDRFAEPEIYMPTSSVAINATQYGPSVISPPIGCDLEFGFIQQRLPKPPFTSSELEGLNLNITVPAGITSGKNLPVFVFLHGGGFFIGGNSWPQYDLAKFVQLSIAQHEPVIAININYRVGVFGFLTSEELRNSGYLGNNGLRDQQAAFEWIKKNISGFGGDPDNITVGGESAGGVSTTLHLYSEKPQFTRAISMGGTALLMKPLPPAVHEMTYRTVLEKLGITATSAQERVEALLNVSVGDILAKLPPWLPLHPIIDGDIIPTTTLFNDIVNKQTLSMPGKRWCKSLLIGDNQQDATIFISSMEHREGTLVDNFISCIQKHLEPHTADALLRLYNISTSMSNDEAVLAVLNFATDIGFLAPTLTFAKGWPGDAYVYFFNEPNPWEGRFQGQASHILDVAFLFQNYNEFLDPVQAQSARQFASDVIKFVNGKAPWTAFDEKTSWVRVYGPSQAGGEAVALEISGKEDLMTKRRADIFQFAPEPGLDVISNIFGRFLAG